MTTLHEMPSTPTRRRTLRTLLLTVATLTLTGASADAAVTRLAIAADPDVIYACYVPGSGTLYRIKATDPTETCKSPDHIPLQWFVNGPQGAQGAQGPVGPQGPAGPAGAVGQAGQAGPIGPIGAAGPLGAVGPTGNAGIAGSAGLEVVEASANNAVLDSDQQVVAHCPAGKKVISGGFIQNPANGNVAESRPSSDRTAWVVYVTDLALNSPTVKAFAVCAVWLP